MGINTTTAFASAQGTVSNTVLSLLDFFTDAEVKQASRCYIFVNTNSIRIDWSGNDPTISTGALISGAYNIDENTNLYQLRMIRHDAIDSEVFILLEA